MTENRGKEVRKWAFDQLPPEKQDEVIKPWFDREYPKNADKRKVREEYERRGRQDYVMFDPSQVAHCFGVAMQPPDTPVDKIEITNGGPGDCVIRVDAIFDSEVLTPGSVGKIVPGSERIEITNGSLASMVDFRKLQGWNSPEFQKGYEIVVQDEQTGIKCLHCGLTSWNSNDVEHRYCGSCHVFHESTP